jgi:hypothetical protein
MVNMRTKIICLLVFVVSLVLGSELLAQSNLDYCPANPNDQSIKPLTSEEGTPPSPKVYTIPRKQVMMELATATW